MSKEVKALITIYKQIKSVNEYRFIGFTPWEIAIELEKFTGVSFEYAQEQELIDAIKRVRK